MDRAALDAALGRLAEALSVAAPPEEARAAWLAFALEVVRWNRRLNLTGARTPEALVEVLFCDALVLGDTAWLPTGARFADIGAGAGAPALPLCWLRPDLRAILVEPIGKRVAFQRSLIGGHDLADRVTVYGQRLDEAAPALPEPVDVAMSRATFPPERWLAAAARLDVGSALLFAVEDIPMTPEGLVERDARGYRMPFTGSPRRLILYDRG